MSDIPPSPTSCCGASDRLRSVANLTRADGEEFLELARRIPVHTTVVPVPSRTRERGARRRAQRSADGGRGAQSALNTSRHDAAAELPAFRKGVWEHNHKMSAAALRNRRSRRRCGRPGRCRAALLTDDPQQRGIDVPTTRCPKCRNRLALRHDARAVATSFDEDLLADAELRIDRLRDGDHPVFASAWSRQAVRRCFRLRLVALDLASSQVSR